MTFKVTKGPVVRPHATILTGRSGIGKTYFASTIDARFFICVEQGLSGAHPELVDEIPRFDQQPKNLGEFFEMLAAFKAQARAEGWRHLVVDSLSGIEALVNIQACGQEKVAHMEAKDFKKVWAAAMPIWQRVQRELDAVRDQAGAHLWIIAHSQETTEVVETGDTFAKYDLAFQGSGKSLGEIRQLWRAWADHVLFLDWQATIKKAGSIGQKAVGQYRSRLLWTRETPRLFAKSRSAVPETLPATWEDLRKALGGPTAAVGAKTRTQVVQLLDRLDVAGRAEIEKALRVAKTPAALAEVLSRAQGMVAVLELEAENGEIPTTDALPAEAPLAELPPESAPEPEAPPQERPIEPVAAPPRERPLEPAPAPAPAPAPSAPPAPAPAAPPAPAPDKVDLAVKSVLATYPHAGPEAEAIASSPLLGESEKLAELRKLWESARESARQAVVERSKAAAASAPAPANTNQAKPDPKAVELRKRVNRLVEAAKREGVSVSQILTEYGVLEQVSASDLEVLISELEAVLNGRAA